MNHSSVEDVVKFYAEKLETEIVKPMRAELDDLKRSARNQFSSSTGGAQLSAGSSHMTEFETALTQIIDAEKGVDSFVNHVKRGLKKRGVVFNA